jgi:hypothetical protein
MKVFVSFIKAAATEILGCLPGAAKANLGRSAERWRKLAVSSGV